MLVKNMNTIRTAASRFYCRATKFKEILCQKYFTNNSYVFNNYLCNRSQISDELFI
jgi:hypothetical protein